MRNLILSFHWELSTKRVFFLNFKSLTIGFHLNFEKKKKTQKQVFYHAFEHFVQKWVFTNTTILGLWKLNNIVFVLNPKYTIHSVGLCLHNRKYCFCVVFWYAVSLQWWCLWIKSRIYYLVVFPGKLTLTLKKIAWQMLQISWIGAFPNPLISKRNAYLTLH